VGMGQYVLVAEGYVMKYWVDGQGIGSLEGGGRQFERG